MNLTPEQRTRYINEFLGRFSGLSDEDWELLLQELNTRVDEALRATREPKLTKETK